MEKINTILYLGDGNLTSNSFHRSKALERLGYKVILVNTNELLRSNYSFILNKLHYRTGYSLVQSSILQKLKVVLKEVDRFDLIWVNGGEYFGSGVLELLKSTNKKIVLYNNDDPTGGRDGNRFNSLLKSLSYYDLCVVMRKFNVDEYLERGAKNAFRVFMSYDEIAHKPFGDISNIDSRFKSDIVFIGTWMKNEKRDLFLSKLIGAGLNVSIWGNRWEKSTCWSLIKNHHKGNSLSGRDYVAAIQGSKICIGMLSKGNRDLHTRRSVEIPYIGGLLCAERTIEHVEMYEEGKEAIFWDDADECIAKCKEILMNDHRRIKICETGSIRVKSNKVGNMDICEIIMEEISILSKK